MTRQEEVTIMQCCTAQEALALYQEWKHQCDEKVQAELPKAMHEIDKCIRSRASNGYGSFVVDARDFDYDIAESLANAIAEKMCKLGYRVIHNEDDYIVTMVWKS